MFVKRLLKKIWHVVFEDHPFSYIGSLVLPLLPTTYLSRFNDEFFTANGPRGLIATLVRSAINRQYYSQSDEQIRKLNRQRFWGGKAGKQWHAIKTEAYGDCKKYAPEFLQYRKILVNQIQDLCNGRHNFTTVCEIGTGNGMFLDYLASQLPGIETFVGIDLNKDQIEENKTAYACTRLNFVHSEISDYINLCNCGERVIFVAYGTLQYFTQNELEALFELIRRNVRSAAIAIAETINIDIASQFSSTPRGNIAYSHNYPSLLERSDFRILKREVVNLDQNAPLYQAIVMVGTNDAA
jgi:2-polyprenyl-3-methyl-5-hydroxy-6-metoxy-1,4-benzoquinol methylase